MANKKGNAVYVMRCDRCGDSVEYVGYSAYSYARKMRERDGRYLCKKCRRNPEGECYLIRNGKDEAVLTCPKCGSKKQLHGSGSIYGYVRRYGWDCSSYVCMDCRRKSTHQRSFGYKVCSRCGSKTPILNKDMEYKYTHRYNALHPYVCPECRRKESHSNWVVVCRKCGRERILSIPSERAYWKYCGANGKSYICEDCRRIDADFKVRGKGIKSLESTREFKSLSDNCKRMLAECISNGFTEMALDSFLMSLSDYLKGLYIFDFDLDVVDGKIIGIYLRRVSLYGTVYVPFENHAKAFGRGGVPR